MEVFVSADLNSSRLEETSLASAELIQSLQTQRLPERYRCLDHRWVRCDFKPYFGVCVCPGGSQDLLQREDLLIEWLLREHVSVFEWLWQTVTSLEASFGQPATLVVCSL